MTKVKCIKEITVKGTIVCCRDKKYDSWVEWKNHHTIHDDSGAVHDFSPQFFREHFVIIPEK